MLIKRLQWALVALPALLLMGLIGAVSPASAAWPGANGKIAFTQHVRPSCNESVRGVCPPGTDHIFVMGNDGSSPVDLTLAGGATDPVSDLQEAWSPDGTKLAFTRGTENFSAIWTMSADGSGQKQITAPPQFSDDVTPEWSPSGTQIVYAHDEEALEDSGIFVTSADGTGTPKQLTTGRDASPVWSPDGKQIAFMRRVGGAPEIWIMNSDGTGQVSLELTGVRPDWAPDSSALVYTDQSYIPQATLRTTFGSTIVVVKPDGSSPTPITAYSDDIKAAVFSPDGLQMAYVLDEIDVGKMSATGASRQLLASGSSEVWNTKPDWQPVATVTAAATVPACSATGAIPVTVSIAPAGFPSTPKAVHFKVDGGAEQVVPTSSGIGTVTVPNGTHTLEYWGEDTGGTMSAHVTATVTADTVNKCAAPAVIPVPPKIHVAGVRAACVSKAFHVRFRVATTAAVKSVTVKLDGKRIGSTKKSVFTLTIKAQKLSAGRHRLTIRAVDASGKATTMRKTFSVCKAVKPRRQAAPRFTG